jgi:hypothetical protein
MAVRRFSSAQVLKLVEGAEAVAEATGLSVSEVCRLVLSEPAAEATEDAVRAISRAAG